MNKGLVIFGLFIIIGFAIFKYAIVPQIEYQIQVESSKYLGSLGGFVTLERLNSICGLANTEISVFGLFSFPVRSVVETVSPEVVERCDQLAMLMQIMSYEIYAYIAGFFLLVIGLVIGGGKTIIREVVKEHHEEVEDEETPKIKKGKTSVKYCSSCGNKIKPNGKFCGKCGKKVKKKR